MSEQLKYHGLGRLLAEKESAMSSKVTALQKTYKVESVKDNALLTHSEKKLGTKFKKRTSSIDALIDSK